MSTPGIASVEDALRVLARLEDADRRWILERLPPEARARLVRELPLSTEDLITPLAGADPGVLLDVLQAEPVWVVQGVLAAADWPWRKEFLRRAPATLRIEIAHLARSGFALAGPATRVLLQTLSKRLGTIEHTPRPRLGFESLLERFTGKGSS